MKKTKIIIVAAARPNFMKIAPLMEEFKKHQKFNPILVHTGQHYDYNMSGSFFKELNIPKPKYNLEIKAGLHGEQTGKTMIEFEKVCLEEKPDLVIVVGDVNATVACALVASKLHIKLAHIEAGLRSFNKGMPEEINRILTDHISDYLFCPTENAVKCLKKEGITENVYNVGDLMYDLFLKNIKIAEKKSKILKTLKLKPKKYYLATIHRAGNTNDQKKMKEIFDAFCKIKNIIIPCHPRTEKYLKKYKLWDKVNKNIRVIKPIGYFDMMWLLKSAKKTITDSGGLQKEAYFAKTPCLTLRDQTEWTETLDNNWNKLIEINKEKIIKNILRVQSPIKQNKLFGSSKTSKQIAIIIKNCFKGKDSCQELKN